MNNIMDYNIELFLQNEYDKIERYKYKKNAEILFNIIRAKNKFGKPDYCNSLYLDVKKFILNYISAAEKQDYGYDEIKLEKIKEVCCCLKKKEQLSVLYTTRRLLYMRGYELDEILKIITNLKCSIAKEEKNYFLYIRLLLSSNIWWLLFAYLIYALVIFVVLLPAPFNFMEMYNIEFKFYNSIPLYNHVLNTMAVLTGNEDLAPTITPLGLGGMLSYCIGIILFYLLIANFVLKKIEDFITLK